MSTILPVFALTSTSVTFLLPGLHHVEGPDKRIVLVLDLFALNFGVRHFRLRDVFRVGFADLGLGFELRVSLAGGKYDLHSLGLRLETAAPITLLL